MKTNAIHAKKTPDFELTEQEMAVIRERCPHLRQRKTLRALSPEIPVNVVDGLHFQEAGWQTLSEYAFPNGLSDDSQVTIMAREDGKTTAMLIGSAEATVVIDFGGYGRLVRVGFPESLEGPHYGRVVWTARRSGDDEIEIVVAQTFPSCPGTLSNIGVATTVTGEMLVTVKRTLRAPGGKMEQP